jgi:hypothetical protein
MDKGAVLALDDEVWADLMRAAAAVPEGRRDVEGVVPGWSSHDVVWHVAYWVARAARVLEEVRPGGPYPEEPEEGAYYDAENDAAMPAGRAMTWDAVLAHGEQGHDRARRVVAECDETVSAWVRDRYLEEVDHFREHAAQINAFLQR